METLTASGNQAGTCLFVSFIVPDSCIQPGRITTVLTITESFKTDDHTGEQVQEGVQFAEKDLKYHLEHNLKSAELVRYASNMFRATNIIKARLSCVLTDRTCHRQK